MISKHLFDFNTDISAVTIPAELNNPFGNAVPEIARVAASEFQAFLLQESQQWAHDFSVQKGKMFGVLVVQKADGTLGYLGTVSGKLQGDTVCDRFVPSVFDESKDDFYINKGMKELTAIGNLIKASDDKVEIAQLKTSRKEKSIALQLWLFENYRFLNVKGEVKDVVQIFDESLHNNPPAAAGECAGPKLLQYALQHELKPIAMAEFWWGISPKNKERKDKGFYPACKNKCRPILEFMLDDDTLFEAGLVCG